MSLQLKVWFLSMGSSFRELKKEIEHIKKILGNDCSIIQLKSATSDDITSIFTDVEGNDHAISCNITTVSTTTTEKNLNEPLGTFIFNLSLSNSRNDSNYIEILKLLK